MTPRLQGFPTADCQAGLYTVPGYDQDDGGGGGGDDDVDDGGGDVVVLT